MAILSSFSGYVATDGWPQTKKWYGSYMGKEPTSGQTAFERLITYFKRDGYPTLYVYGTGDCQKLIDFEQDWIDNMRNAGSSIGGDSYNGYFRGNTLACEEAKTFMLGNGIQPEDGKIVFMAIADDGSKKIIASRMMTTVSELRSFYDNIMPALIDFKDQHK